MTDSVSKNCTDEEKGVVRLCKVILGDPSDEEFADFIKHCGDVIFVTRYSHFGLEFGHSL